jgi:hypothetical protein
MNTDPILRAVATAVMPAVFVDLVVFGILRMLPNAMIIHENSIGNVLSRFFISVMTNVLVLGAFSFAYLGTWGGTGRAFLFGGGAWVIVATPVLLMSGYLDPTQRQELVVRVFGWLFKTAIASASCYYFIG